MEAVCPLPTFTNKDDVPCRLNSGGSTDAFYFKVNFINICRQYLTLEVRMWFILTVSSSEHGE